MRSDRYAQSFDATVERNSQDQDDDARPKIKNALPDVGPYDTVLIGSPVWGVRAPMIMSTFIEAVDLSGKRVLPFVTYAVSGMSGVDDAYEQPLPDSDVGTGLAVKGETVASSGEQLDDWLRTTQLTTS